MYSTGQLLGLRQLPLGNWGGQLGAFELMHLRKGDSRGLPPQLLDIGWMPDTSSIQPRMPRMQRWGDAMQSQYKLCSAVQCGAVQCSAVQCSAVRCGAVQCSAVRCGAVRCAVHSLPAYQSCIYMYVHVVLCALFYVQVPDLPQLAAR